MEFILGSLIRIRDRIRYPQEGGMTIELIDRHTKDADLTATERARVATTQSMVGLPIEEPASGNAYDASYQTCSEILTTYQSY